MFTGCVPADEETYGAVLSRNVVAARARARLKQSEVADRMRALGFSWHPQTVGEVERGTRRLMAEEILGIALAVGATVGALMEPAAEDRTVVLPSGAELPGGSVQASVRHVNDGRVRWDDGKPVIGEPGAWRYTGPPHTLSGYGHLDSAGESEARRENDQ